MIKQVDYQCRQCGSWYRRGDNCNKCGTIQRKQPKVYKVLSIQQPWAWAICYARKDIENRNWPTKFRGKFLVHASKKIDMYGYNFLDDMGYNPPNSNKIDVGGIVGEAEIINCIKSHNSKWFCGPFGFVLRNQKPLQFAPLKGQLGFFNYTVPEAY